MGATGSNNNKKNDKSRSSRSTQRVASKKDLDTFREICQLARIDFERHRETFSTSSLKKSRREKLLDIYADVEHLLNAKRVKEAEKPKNLLRKKCLQYFYGGLEEEGRGGGEEKEKEKEENRNEETFEEDSEKKVSMELKRARVKKPSRFDQSEMGALVEAAGGGTTKVAPPPPPAALVGVPHGLPSFHMQQQQQQQQQQQMMMMMPPYQMQQQQQLFYGQQHLQQQQYQHQAYPIGMSGYQMPPPVLTRQPLGMPPMSVISGQAQYPSPPPPWQQFQEQQP